jgi:hypothetical protein
MTCIKEECEWHDCRNHMQYRRALSPNAAKKKEARQTNTNHAEIGAWQTEYQREEQAPAEVRHEPRV